MSTATSPSLALHFGALCEPIAKQIEAAGLVCAPKDAKLWQRMADGITICAIQQILTQGEVRKARQRLIDRIAKGVTSL